MLKCQETKITDDLTKRNTFAWVTDVRPNKHNAARLVREARRRWVVEEAFNIQKNGGYELTHNFGTIGFAMKNYYDLLQIAHILHQLMVRSDLFPKMQTKFIMCEFGCDQEEMKTLLACMTVMMLGAFPHHPKSCQVAGRIVQKPVVLKNGDCFRCHWQYPDSFSELVLIPVPQLVSHIPVTIAK